MYLVDAFLARLPEPFRVHLDGVVDLGQRVLGELDVDHGAGDGHDAARLELAGLGGGGLGDGHGVS